MEVRECPVRLVFLFSVHNQRKVSQGRGDNSREVNRATRA